MKGLNQRVSVQDGQVIILKKSADGLYHAYIHENLKTLTQKVLKALVENGYLKHVTSTKLI